MKYTHEERLEIGRRIYTGETSKYQAAAEYWINYQTARNYMRIYRDANKLPSKNRTPGYKTESVAEERRTRHPVIDPNLEEYESMTKEELQIQDTGGQAKKGYEVKGDGAEKVFIPLGSKNMPAARKRSYCAFWTMAGSLFPIMQRKTQFVHS